VWEDKFSRISSMPVSIVSVVFLFLFVPCQSVSRMACVPFFNFWTSWPIFIKSNRKVMPLEDTPTS
jgi:hypothetical protein